MYTTIRQGNLIRHLGEVDGHPELALLLAETATAKPFLQVQRPRARADPPGERPSRPPNVGEDFVDPRLRFVGYVVNRLKMRANITKAYVGMYEERLGNELLKTRIKDSVKYQEAISAGEPITKYASSSELADTFRQLAQEIDL